MTKIVPVAALTLALSACGTGGAQQKMGSTPEVGFIVARASDVPVGVELSGRVTAFQSAEVRPQVTGLIYRRLFREGQIVRQGQTLYQIDPSIFVAAANEAQANLASAQASAEAARARAERFKPLAEIEAVAKQDYADALAQARQADAAIAQNQARLASARINLRFTRVPAPITGRIGRSLFTEGALVTAGQAAPLATIQRLDPIFVDVQQSSADLLTLRRSLAAGGAVPSSAAVRLILEDGSEYPIEGRVEFSEVVVNPSTGTVTLRAAFPNPQGLLLPGMFARARFAQSIERGVFLVPQAGVARDPRGRTSVKIIGPGNKVIIRPVTATRVVGSDWVVTGGIAAGDTIIVEGTSKAKPDATVKPVPAGTPQKIGAAPPPKA